MLGGYLYNEPANGQVNELVHLCYLEDSNRWAFKRVVFLLYSFSLGEVVNAVGVLRMGCKVDVKYSLVIICLGSEGNCKAKL